MDVACVEFHIQVCTAVMWHKYSGVVQAEKELSEVNLQLESLHERLEEADGLSSAQVAIATHSHLSCHYNCESRLIFVPL